MQAAAKKEAEEAARKAAEAAEAAKVEAARKAAEQARMNALGLGDRIAEYEGLLDVEGVSNADKYEYEQTLERLRAEKKKSDATKKAAEEAQAEQER
jgi:hypothetical protein